MFQARNLPDSVFETEGFKMLFEKTRNIKNLRDWTALMVLCSENPALLERKQNFIQQLIE